MMQVAVGRQEVVMRMAFKLRLAGDAALFGRYQHVLVQLADVLGYRQAFSAVRHDCLTYGRVTWLVVVTASLGCRF